MASVNWNTAVSSLLGCRYPILLAGMGGVARHQLAAAVSKAHPMHNEKIIQADAADTVLTRVFWKNWHEAALVRVLKNTLSDNNDAGSAEQDLEIAQQDGNSVYRNSTDSPLAGATGQLELMALYAGLSCAHINEVVSASQRLMSLVTEAELLSAKAAQTDAHQDVTEVASSPCYMDKSMLY